MDFSRYSRQVAVPGIGRSGQQKLQDARVLVVGAGGLGNPVVAYLAAAGVGRLEIVDDDLVSLDNLGRQFLFSESDIGQSKVQVLSRRASETNSEVKVVPVSGKFSTEMPLESFDLVVDATDNFEARYAISDACLENGIPHVWGAIFRYEGWTAVFPPDREKNYRAHFPSRPPTSLSPTCESGGVVGPVCGIIGSVMAAQSIQHLTTGRASLEARVASFDVENMSFSVHDVVKDSEEEIEREPAADPMRAGISPDELSMMLRSDEPPQVVDVRDSLERATGHIPDSLHVPLKDVWGWARTREDRPVVFYCASGKRSLQAVEICEQVQRGSKELLSLDGGWAKWKAYEA